MKTKSLLPCFFAADSGAFELGAKAKTSFRPIVWVPLFLTLAFASTGYPVPINILDAQYTTTVSFGGPTNFSRTQISPVPISDSVNDPYNVLMATANAGLLGVSGFTTYDYVNIAMGFNRSAAYAESDLWFSPLTSQTATINIQFSVNYRWQFTGGDVSLLDVTSDNELWNYGWSGSGEPETYETPVIWEGVDTITVTLDTDLNASDTYELSMNTGSNAGSDSEQESIQLSGLEPIPEPASLSLLAFGIIGITLLRRHQG